MEKILIIGLVAFFVLAIIDIIARRSKQKHEVSVKIEPNEAKSVSPVTIPSPVVTEKIVYKASFGSHTCTHGAYGGPKMLTIQGKSIGIGASPFCEACTIEYFNKYSTKCDKCGDLICPTMPVGQHYVTQADGTEKLLTVCQKMSCALPGDLVGTWGEGKVLPMPWGSGSPVHEKKPEPVAVVEEKDEAECEVQKDEIVEAEEEELDVASELGKSKGAEILIGTTFGSAYETPESSPF